MPSELLENSQQDPPAPPAVKNPPTPTAPIDVDKILKRPKLTPNLNNWNPKLKAKLEGPLNTAGNPSFTKIMNFCKKDVYSIFPKGSSACAPNAFFGICFFGDKCTKKHTPASEAQVQPILDLLEGFIKDPAKVKSGY